jgi:hypothetical protein
MADAASILAQAQGSSGSASTTSSPPVNDITELPPDSRMYWGPQYAALGSNQGLGGMGVGGTQQVFKTAQDWENYFYLNISNDPTARQQFATEAELANLVGPNANVAQLYSAWQKLIVQAYNHSINGQNQTPWDILANSIPGTGAGSYSDNTGQGAMQTMTAQQAADLAAKASAANTQKDVQTSEVDINYTDPDTARYVLNQASQQLLGRNATNAEIASFTKNLNTDERLFPKMTQDTKSTQGTTTSATTPGLPTSETGSTGQTVVGYDSAGNPIFGPTGTTTTGTSDSNTTDTVVSLGEQDYTKYGRTQLANDAAMASPDYGAYQAAGPLFQAFLGTLKGAVSGVGSNS